MVAQVADRLGSDAAAPDVAVGRDVTAGPTGITGNDLPSLVENSLGELVVLGTEALGDTGDAAGRALARLLAEEVGDGGVVIGLRGDVPTDGI